MSSCVEQRAWESRLDSYIIIINHYHYYYHTYVPSVHGSTWLDLTDVTLLLANMTKVEACSNWFFVKVLLAALSAAIGHVEPAQWLAGGTCHEEHLSAQNKFKVNKIFKFKFPKIYQYGAVTLFVVQTTALTTHCNCKKKARTSWATAGLQEASWVRHRPPRYAPEMSSKRCWPCNTKPV